MQNEQFNLRGARQIVETHKLCVSTIGIKPERLYIKINQSINQSILLTLIEFP